MLLSGAKANKLGHSQAVILMKISSIHFRAAEEDIESQKQELMAGFDDALRKREHEFRKKADDLSNSLLSSELKVCLRVRCVC